MMSVPARSTSLAAAGNSASALHAALADPTREAIVRLLAEGERAVGEIAAVLPVSRPAVSKHLRLLEGAGLVRFRTEGTRNLYVLDPTALATLRDELDALWRVALARFALDADNRRRASAGVERPVRAGTMAPPALPRPRRRKP